MLRMTLRPRRRAYWAALCWWWLPPLIAGQIGLLSPGISAVGGPRASWWWSGGGVAAPSLLTQLGERPPLPRRSPSTRESEIAAIFRGVAYGAPTSAPNTTTSLPPPTTTVDIKEGSAPPETSVKLVQLQQNAATADISYIVHIMSNITDAADVTSSHEGEDASPEDADTSSPHPRVVEVPSPHSTPENIPSRPLGGHEGAFWGDMSGVRWWLGAAWWIHVYVSAGLLALLAAAALCCMARSTLLLPRPHYLTAHALVFLGAALRSLQLFHDPYGVERRLPTAVASAVEETSWPCLTAALAVVVVVLARSVRTPARPHATLVLALMTVLHLLVSLTAHTAAHLLLHYALPLRVVARAVTATWGAGVGVGGVWAVWRVKKSVSGRRGQLLSHVSRGGRSSGFQCGLQRGAHLALVASVAQVMLATLHLYVLVAPLAPATHVWAWWARVSLARGLELVVGLAVVVSVGLVSQGRAHAPRDAHIFSMLGSCGREVKVGRSANVFPACEKQHILGTFRPPHNPPNQAYKPPMLDWASPDEPEKSDVPSVTSDFQLVWNRERTRSATEFRPPRAATEFRPPRSATEFRPPSMLVNDSGFVRFRTGVDPQQAMDDVFKQSSLNLRDASYTKTHEKNVRNSAASYITTHQNYSSQTLPSTRYYCGPGPTFSSPERTPIRRPIRSHTARGRRAAQELHSAHHQTLPITSASRYDVHTLEDYEVASYYHHQSGSVSGSSNMYSTPMSPTQCGRQQQPVGVHRGRTTTQQDALSGVLEPSTCSSLSEIHIDYLTDVSSSNDGVNLGSLLQQRLHPHHLLTLPLTAAHNPRPAHCRPAKPDLLEAGHREEVKPNSPEGKEDVCEGEGVQVEGMQVGVCEGKPQGGGGRAGLLSKLAGSGLSATCYGYSPLDLEDTSSPSQDAAPPPSTSPPSSPPSSLHTSRTTSTLPRPPDIVTSL
nr:uncharacterized protein LOC128697193 [Cherax quadricarinatus]